MNTKSFEAVVEKALTAMPAEFRDRLSNVVVIVENAPSQELLSRMNIPEDDTLLDRKSTRLNSSHT